MIFSGLFKNDPERPERSRRIWTKSVERPERPERSRRTKDRNAIKKTIDFL